MILIRTTVLFDCYLPRCTFYCFAAQTLSKRKVSSGEIWFEPMMRQALAGRNYENLENNSKFAESLMYHLLTVLSLLGSTTADANTSNASYPTPIDFEVERVTRSFRIQVYNTFRNDRDEYERRREVGNTVYRSYTASAQDEQHRSHLMDWYCQAIVASQSGKVLELPAAPAYINSDPASDPADLSQLDVQTNDPGLEIEEAGEPSASETAPIGEVDNFDLSNFDLYNVQDKELEDVKKSAPEPQRFFPVFRGLGRAVMDAVWTDQHQANVNEKQARVELNLETSETTVEDWEQPTADSSGEEDEFTETNPVTRYVEPPQIEVELTEPNSHVD